MTRWEFEAVPRRKNAFKVSKVTESGRRITYGTHRGSLISLLQGEIVLAMDPGDVLVEPTGLFVRLSNHYGASA